MSCGDFTCWMPLQKLWKAKNQFWPRPSQKWWSMSNRNTSKYAVVHQSNSQSRWKIFKLSSLKLRPTHQVKNNPQKGTLFQFYVSVLREHGLGRLLEQTWLEEARPSLHSQTIWSQPGSHPNNQEQSDGGDRDSAQPRHQEQPPHSPAFGEHHRVHSRERSVTLVPW